MEELHSILACRFRPPVGRIIGQEGAIGKQHGSSCFTREPSSHFTYDDLQASMCMQIRDGVTRRTWKMPAALSWQDDRTAAAAGPAQGSPQPAVPDQTPSSGTVVHRDAGHCLQFKVQGSKGSGKLSLITACQPTFMTIFHLESSLCPHSACIELALCAVKSKAHHARCMMFTSRYYTRGCTLGRYCTILITHKSDF